MSSYIEGIREHVGRIAQVVPAAQFAKGKARLAVYSESNRRTRMEENGQRLGDFAKGQILNGVKSGLNDAFVIDRPTRQRLLDDHGSSATIIKPFLLGDDIRRYESYFRDRFILYVLWDTDISLYPAILAWLKNFRSDLEKRDGVKNEGTCPWYALSRPRPDVQKLYEAPKIVYPDIGKESRFAMDTQGHYISNTTYLIPQENWYLLGVLNSAAVFEYLKGTCAALGDEDKGGRLRFFDSYMETLPIPQASAKAQSQVASLASKSQAFHAKRRQIAETLLRKTGCNPANSTSRNPLEQPWKLTPADFRRRARNGDLETFLKAHDETVALTDEIAKIEHEIDERVAVLYGL